MRWTKHLELEGRHSFLSASKPSWVNYDSDKMAVSYRTFLAAMQGTRLHEFASNAINLGIKLPSSKKTMNMYVNDAIGFRMQTEQPLSYSENAFGTADAISFRKERNFDLPVLRIHDLKTGVNEAPFVQLIIYVAYFCLEYDVNPADILIELRIYQNDAIKILEPDLDDIIRIMDTIKSHNDLIVQLRAEAFD